MKKNQLKIVTLLLLILLSSCNLSKKKSIITSLQTIVDTTSLKFQYKSMYIPLKTSKDENRLILIYFTSDGCGPCLNMEHTVFTDSLVKDFYKKNFICCKSHIKRESGPQTKQILELNKSISNFMEEFDVNGTPSFIIIDSEGKLIHKKTGSMSANEFIQFGKDALSDDKNYPAIEAKIKKGDYSFETVKLYLEGTLQSSSFLDYIFGSKIQKVVDNYFKNQKKLQWSSDNNWYIINRFVKDFKSEQFQYLLHNQSLYFKKFGKIDVDNKIFRVVAQYEYNGGDISNLSFPQVKLVLERNKLKKKNFEDLNIFAKDNNEIYTQYYYLFDYEIYINSQEIYEASKQENTKIKKQTLERASNWMKLVTTYQPESINYRETYSNILNKLTVKE